MAYCNRDAGDDAMTAYHDNEWGTPVHDDRKMFEHLMMEVMQCGLSWRLMMRKREIFRACFHEFDYDVVAAFRKANVDAIMETPRMIRSRPKIEAIINNARCFQQIRAEEGSFSAWLWAYTDGKTVLYDKHAQGWIPASNGLSCKIAKDLRVRGFTFLGPTTVYSHLQACGLINDHDANCPRYAEINAANPTICRRRHLESNVRYFGDDGDR